MLKKEEYRSMSETSYMGTLLCIFSQSCGKFFQASCRNTKNGKLRGNGEVEAETFLSLWVKMSSRKAYREWLINPFLEICFGNTPSIYEKHTMLIFVNIRKKLRADENVALLTFCILCHYTEVLCVALFFLLIVETWNNFTCHSFLK